MTTFNNSITFTTCNLIVLCSLIGCTPNKSTENTAPQQRPLEVFKVESISAASIKNFNGKVYSHEQAGLSFRVPGLINEMLVEKGSLVTKGQLIAKLDPHDYQVTLEELQAKKLEAESAHKLAKSELSRIKAAINDDAIADVNLDRAISGYERSLSAIKVVDKNIQRAKDMLAYTAIVAPFDGVVTKVAFEQFEQVLPGVAVVTLQDDSQLEVQVDVPENLVSQFTIGQKGVVSWYQSDKSFPGIVSEIAPTPHFIKQTYAVTYTLESISNGLFPGKAVTVTTSMGTPNSSYCIPYSAIIEQENETYINLVRSQKIISTLVDVDFLKAKKACVTGNLRTGDYVVVSGSYQLHSGDVVDQLVIRNQ